MKNTILLFAIAMLSISQSFAQDRLFFLNGDETDVKITEISSSEVKYKRLDNLEGPSFSTLKSELFMIKYANGDKEMMTAQTAEPAPAQQEEYTTSDDVQTNKNSGSGLSSAVIVTDEPSSTSPSNVDKWGRTESENRGLYKKKIVKGAVLLGVGGAMAIPGVVLFGLATRYDNLGLVTYGDTYGDTYRVVGALLVVGGVAMVIAGSAIMGTSAKYKKRANQLANGTVRLSPALMNDARFSGVNVKSNPGFGVSF
ncbi:phage holin family protein, partial [Flavobacteriales bacterium]|nr:phage holin family protein [Flavobacteriales bacterium]